MHYEPLTFTIPSLNGISQETVDLHIGLYNGYVKNVNQIHEKITIYNNEPDIHGLAISELQRRFGFEFGGMRNHEYYFTQLENGAQPLGDSKFKDLINRQWGSLDIWLNNFKKMALTRGIGWAMLYHDPHTNQLVETWVDEQHIGHLVDLDIVLALDMWEHAYLRDHLPVNKKDYVEAFFNNLNWSVVSERIA